MSAGSNRLSRSREIEKLVVRRFLRREKAFAEFVRGFRLPVFYSGNCFPILKSTCQRQSSSVLLQRGPLIDSRPNEGGRDVVVAEGQPSTKAIVEPKLGPWRQLALRKKSPRHFHVKRSAHLANKRHSVRHFDIGRQSHFFSHSDRGRWAMASTLMKTTAPRSIRRQARFSRRNIGLRVGLLESHT